MLNTVTRAMTASLERDIPRMGPRKMPRLPLKAKKLKALAWVLGVLFSVIIARTVLLRVLVSHGNLSKGTSRAAHTIVPAKTPAKHLKTIICHIVLLSPKSDVAMATPDKENTRTGFLPKRSAARPHEIISSI